MKTYIDCIHCYLRQAVTCMTIAKVDEETQYKNLFELMDLIKNMDRNNTPAENSTKLLMKVYKQIGLNDPYQKEKKQSNDLALKLYPKIKDLLDKSDNRLYDALKISVAGNVIDLGINRTFDIDASLKYSLEVGFSKDDYDKFINKLNKVDEVLILGDNSGEIVFDKILVEELLQMNKKVTYVVKDRPILNDSTMEDALYVGMNNVAKVVTTGTNYLGTPLKYISDECLTLLKNADLVISKGQANFESLEHEELAKNRIFFLLKIKCEGVAEVAETKFGDVVFFVK